MVLKYSSPSHPWKGLGRGDKVGKALRKGEDEYIVVNDLSGAVRCRLWGPVDGE